MVSPVLVGVSLKMYFGHRQSLDWCASVAELSRSHAAVTSGAVELFVIPGYLSVPAAVEIFADGPVAVGAQDLATEDNGAYTGEVSGVELAEVGVRVAEVGHAERRRLFGETDDIVRQKTTAALRNTITPVLCIGESAKSDPAEAAAESMRQVVSALEGAPDGRVIVAYEPVWAIGAAEPAPADYIRAVCAILRESVAGLAGRENSAVIYGGSAGPGLLTQLGSDVDGLFLGRFAHDTAALGRVLDEAASVAATRESEAGR
jgi:triosephosphate isomerase